LERLLELFEDESVGAATGMILVSEADHGTIDITKVHPSIHNGHTMLRGGNFAVRREVIHAIGGLDENFVGAANHEDADLAYRLHQHGCKVVWAPKPWLFHLCYQDGGGRTGNPLKHRNFAYNLFYFYLRHHQSINFATLFKLLRWRVFNRDSLFQPWLLPMRLKDFYDGYRLAKVAVAAGPRLPLLPTSSPN
jgi:GT2 family glycosyltransferase